MRRSLRTAAVASAAALLTIFGSPSGDAGAKPKKGPGVAWGTYLGTTSQREGRNSLTTVNDVAVGQDGSVYVVGDTDARRFPVTRGAYQTRLPGEKGGYVAKLSKDGKTLVWATYLGCPDRIDSAKGVAVAPDGRVFVAGEAGAGFPIVGGTEAYGGDGDMYVAELSADGSQLLYSTYLGSDAYDTAAAIALDASGNVYVAGSSAGDITAIPTILPRDDGADWYVAKIDPATNAGVYATYLGSRGAQWAHDIAVDSTGSAVVVGLGGGETFPIVGGLGGPYRYGGGIVKLDPSGDIAFSTFLSGSTYTEIFSVAIDGADDIYVAGTTASPDFPLVNSPYPISETVEGLLDAFAAKISKNGDTLVYSIALAGTGSDDARAIAVTPSGSAAVEVLTDSSDYPLVKPFRELHGVIGATSDVALTKIGADGAIEYSSSAGGTSSEVPGAVAMSPTGDVILGLTTSSPDVGASASAFQPTLPGVTSGFVSEVTPDGKKHKNP